MTPLAPTKDTCTCGCPLRDHYDHTDTLGSCMNCWDDCEAYSQRDPGHGAPTAANGDR